MAFTDVTQAMEALNRAVKEEAHAHADEALGQLLADAIDYPFAELASYLSLAGRLAGMPEFAHLTIENGIASVNAWRRRRRMPVLDQRRFRDT